MNKNSKIILVAKITITLAFVLMICYGFTQLIATRFKKYDSAVLKLDFWTPNLAQTFWNILIILGFFIFILSSIWTMHTTFFFWIWSIIYSIIGLLTFVFTIIENLDDGTKLAIGVVISLLLMVGSGLILFQNIKLMRQKKVNRNTIVNVEQVAKEPPIKEVVKK